MIKIFKREKGEERVKRSLGGGETGEAPCCPTRDRVSARWGEEERDCWLEDVDDARWSVEGGDDLGRRKSACECGQERERGERGGKQKTGGQRDRLRVSTGREEIEEGGSHPKAHVPHHSPRRHDCGRLNLRPPFQIESARRSKFKPTHAT